MKYKILIIEDDKSLGFILTNKIRIWGYDVTHTDDGIRGLEEIKTNSYDLAIIDVGLPGLDGFSIVERIKNLDIEIPVIIMSSDVSIENELKTFKNNANLFHRKPINFKLLELQLQSLFIAMKPNQIYKIKDVEIDSSARVVKRNSKSIPLSFKEFELFLLLLSNPEKAFSRSGIINRTYRGSRNLEQGSIDTLISRFRNKIGNIDDEPIIETVHGYGYRLNKNIINLIESN